jgi:hypothetical protein
VSDIETDRLAKLAKLREPFSAHHISKLPKETKAQADARKADPSTAFNCPICGGWHHKKAVHLDYVGHAALTHRLLDVDPEWSWEPAALRDGLPAFDGTGGLWIRLTVCGVTRLGYGHASGKPNMDAGAREKEVIGDALRNAAMRFGAALDLWHKGDLHPEEEGGANDAEPPAPTMIDVAINVLRGCSSDKALFKETWGRNKPGWQKAMSDQDYARVVGEMKRIADAFPKEEAPPPNDFGLEGDDVPRFAA